MGKLFTLFFFLQPFFLFSQQLQPAAALWELTDPGQGGTGLNPTTSGLVEASEESFNRMIVNQYTGPNNSQRSRIDDNNWPANQTVQLNDVYVQFAISPKPGNNFYAKNINLQLAAASISSMKANIWYSKYEDFSSPIQIIYETGDPNNYLSTTDLTNVNEEISITINEGETLYVRIFPWVDNDPNIRTGKYVCLQNVQISGEIEALEANSKLIYTYENDETILTEGPIIGANPIYGPGLNLVGYDEISFEGGGNLFTSLFSPVSGNWPGNASPNADFYLQYSIKPKFGGTLTLDSISFILGASGTSTLKASVSFSFEPAFSTETFVINDLGFTQGELYQTGSLLNETISYNEEFYIRIYVFNSVLESDLAKFLLHQVLIHGIVEGITSDPPSVTTSSITGISTTFVSSGGNIFTDGGLPVTNRGVVWSTSETPTIANNKTTDGSGSGSFISKPADLTPGETYFLRAYATNDAGTSYGEEYSFTTLGTLEIPTVVTSEVTDILVTSAISGGNVTNWGGADVLKKGICWNASGNPTVDDNFTMDGSGEGTYQSTLFPLEANTTYFARAYATNSQGTGFGNEISFMTPSPAPDVEVIVAKDGSGDYTTIQEAFDNVPDFYTGKYTIFVKSGTYYEKLILERNKVNVTLEGEDVNTTILTYDDYAGKAGGTSNSYSVAIEPDDFTAMNITFQNTVQNDGTAADQQAVALRVNGDRQTFFNCKILGYQDTFYAWGGRKTGRIFMQECVIEGSVDFIFGRDVVVFDKCEIIINRDDGTLTAAATEEVSMYGFVFLNCTISHPVRGFNNGQITRFVLGRPWQGAPRTVFIECEEPLALDPEGWSTWNVTPALYAEYKCTGDGSDFSNRISISRQLTDQEASDYSIENIFSKNTHPSFGYDWMPVLRTTKITGLEQNVLSNTNLVGYPNPSTGIFKLKPSSNKTGTLCITILDQNGQRIETFYREFNPRIDKEVEIDLSGEPYGVYFITLSSSSGMEIIKVFIQPN